MLFYSNYGYHPKFDLLNFCKGENRGIEDFAIDFSQLQAIMELQFEETQDC